MFRALCLVFRVGFPLAPNHMIVTTPLLQTKQQTSEMLNLKTSLKGPQAQTGCQGQTTSALTRPVGPHDRLLEGSCAVTCDEHAFMTEHRASERLRISTIFLAI